MHRPLGTNLQSFCTSTIPSSSSARGVLEYHHLMTAWQRVRQWSSRCRPRQGPRCNVGSRISTRVGLTVVADSAMSSSRPTNNETEAELRLSIGTVQSQALDTVTDTSTYICYVPSTLIMKPQDSTPPVLLSLTSHQMRERMALTVLLAQRDRQLRPRVSRSCPYRAAEGGTP